MQGRQVDLNDLLSKSENIYETIVILAKRARQINEEMKIEFNQRIEMLQTKSYDPEEDGEQMQINPDQILIAKEFEMRLKPTEVAIDELRNDQITYRYKEVETSPLAP